ncbi:hypothetical protein SNE40_018007 [Patella caerulea]|uniref:Uncharacterized protein n=1 Tax=Patella caerulea TaxID=87958 RepID=A0AAN8J879_PATCE
MDITQFVTVIVISALILIRSVRSQKLTGLRKLDCPEDWSEDNENGRCYLHVPSCIENYTFDELTLFCQAVLNADIGYVNGRLSCIDESRIPSSLIVDLLEPRSTSVLRKRVFGNSGFGR